MLSNRIPLTFLINGDINGNEFKAFKKYYENEKDNKEQDKTTTTS